MVVGGVARVSGGKVLMTGLGMRDQMAFVLRGVLCVGGMRPVVRVVRVRVVRVVCLGRNRRRLTGF
jgi:hypothetical protein